LWNPPFVTSSVTFFEASGNCCASMNPLAVPSSKKRHNSYMVWDQKNYSGYHSNMCSKLLLRRWRLTYQGIVMKEHMAFGPCCRTFNIICFIKFEGLLRKVYIVICCWVIALFLH
jgi:hypothetical protein